MPGSERFQFKPDAIGHVLADRSLSVPIYQRSYSWGEQQISDFWTDLNGALATGQNQYFLGNIVLSEEGSDDSYTIIDGQQRLATTLIFLAAIRNEYKRRGDDRRANIIQDEYIAVADLGTGEDKPRLRMNSDDDSYFNQVIVQSTQAETLHASHKLIAKALAYFEEQIAKVADVAETDWEQRLLQRVKLLTSEVLVIVVDVSTEADAYLIFETLNDRGADLTIADLLKNYLFGRSGSQLDTVRDGWTMALAVVC